MGHPGTYVNAPTLGVPGLVVGDSNTAVSFAASPSDQYVVQDDTIAAQSFSALTLGCIIKPVDPTDANEPTFFGVKGTNDNINFSQNADGTITFFAKDGVGAINGFLLNSITVLSSGSVYRLVGTWDGTTAKLWINGALDASVGYTNAVTLALPESFFFGADQFDTTGGFSWVGVGDEAFFVANHAATTGEIATIDVAMTGTGSVVTAINALNPYIYWRLGESSGTVANDSAGTSGNLYTPPVIYDEGPILFDSQGVSRALFRHYLARPRFQTVWKLATNPITYSLDQPFPLVTPDDARMGVLPIGDTATQVTYLHVYYGPEQVDAAEAARLVASGIGTVT